MRFVVNSVLALILGASAATARAEPSSADPAAAQSLYDEGVKLFDGKQYTLACPKFEASIQLNPNLIEAQGMLGLCYELVGRLASAWTVLREVRVQAQRNNRPPLVKLADEHLAALAPRLAKLTITRPSASVVVRKDGVVVPADGFDIPLAIDSGKHTISAEQPGFKPWSQEVAITDGEARAINIPALDALPVPVKPAPEPAPERPPLAGGSSPRRTLALVAGGLSLAALGGALAFELSGRSTYEEYEQSPMDGALFDRANRKHHVAQGLLVGGVALAGAAGYLWLTRGSRSHSRMAAVAPAVGAQLAGFSIGGRF